MRAKRSWLTIGVGCCAERDEVRVEKSPSGDDRSICYEQPRAVPLSPTNPLAPRPSATHHITQWVSTSREYAARASSRASLNVLTRPHRSHSRPSISRPTDFRHTDGFDGIQSMIDEAPMPIRRRRSFRPLQLSIYLPDGRLSPLPDFDTGDSWGSKSADVEMPAQALVRGRDARLDSLSSNRSTFLIQRKPVGSGSRRSSVQSQASVAAHEKRLSDATLNTHPQPSPLTISGPGLRRARTSGTSSPARVISRLPSPSRSRANTAPSRPVSLRRAKTDVDDEIRELNTIIEERRASTYRSQAPWANTGPPPSPSQHVPHFAPSMRMHVRSETLSDIGSAFSVPLSKALPTPSAQPARPTMHTRAYSGPLNSNPITPRQPPTTPIHRLGAWLKRSTTSSSSSSLPPTPFYNLNLNLPLATPTQPSPYPSSPRHDRHPSSSTTTSTSDTIPSHPSSRSASRASSISTAPTLRRPLTGQGAKRRPAPLVLVDLKQSERKAPLSPHYGILPGREMCGRDVGRGGIRMVTPVGVAF